MNGFVVTIMEVGGLIKVYVPCAMIGHSIELIFGIWPNFIRLAILLGFFDRALRPCTRGKIVSNLLVLKNIERDGSELQSSPTL